MASMRALQQELFFIPFTDIILLSMRWEKWNPEIVY